MVLERRIKPIGVGTDLAKTLNIPIVYFDLDKSSIRKDAAYELAKVVVGDATISRDENRSSLAYR